MCTTEKVVPTVEITHQQSRWRTCLSRANQDARSRAAQTKKASTKMVAYCPRITLQGDDAADGTAQGTTNVLPANRATKSASNGTSSIMVQKTSLYRVVSGGEYTSKNSPRCATLCGTGTLTPGPAERKYLRLRLRQNTQYRGYAAR